MCGIYGFVGKPKNKKARKILIKLIKNLAIETEVRGTDATGLFAYGKYTWFQKSTVRAKTFYDRNNYWKKAIMDANFFIGHNRSASIGSKTKVKFAQPFSGKKFAIVHNGTIPDIDNFISDEAYDKSRGENDSKKILRQFNSVGKIDTDFLSYISKYALVIFDKRKKTIYVARDNKRPIGTANFSKELGVRIFASKPEILARACIKSNINIDRKKWYDFEPYILYQLYANKSLDIKKKKVYEFQKKAVVYEVTRPKRTIKKRTKTTGMDHLTNWEAIHRNNKINYYPDDRPTRIYPTTGSEIEKVLVYNPYCGRMTTVEKYNEMIDTINFNNEKKGRSYRAVKLDASGIPIREDTKKTRQKIYDNIFNR